MEYFPFLAMENSAYVPNSGHLNSPALVVFSQAAGGLQDALRIQRPFNPQVSKFLYLHFNKLRPI